jgi:stress response protein YsnF
MTSPRKERAVTGTFNDRTYADLAAEAARKAGFSVERPSDFMVIVDAGTHEQHVGEAEGILRAYGAREFGTETVAGSTSSDKAESAKVPTMERRQAASARLELVEEELRTRTRPVQTGEVTIRKEVVTETRSIEVPVQREELVIERHPVDRKPMDTSAKAASDDPLIGQLMDRLRGMKPGETLRIPIVEEEVIVQKRPVVVEEITVGKRIVQDKETVSDTVRREEVHVEPHGDIRIEERGGR